MASPRFLTPAEDERVVKAIRAVESRTSAEIRVFISHAEVTDVLAAAHETMERLGMKKTRHRNAVLVFIAPVSRKFAFAADEAACAALGESRWSSFTSVLREGFIAGHRADAIAKAVTLLGEELAKVFPRRAGDVNELPDDVTEG